MIRNVRNFVTRLRVQDLVVNTGLDEIAKYADAIGPWKETIAPGSGTNLPINYTTNLVDRCGDLGTAAPSLVTGSAALPNRPRNTALLSASAGRTLMACRCTHTRSAMSP